MYKLKTTYKKLLADTITPVSVYLKIRDKYPNSLLLESSDYHTSENSFSYICSNPIASIKIDKEIISCTYPNGSSTKTEMTPESKVALEIQKFSEKFQVEDSNFKFINNGLFGYIAYDGVRYFEDIKIVFCLLEHLPTSHWSHL